MAAETAEARARSARGAGDASGVSRRVRALELAARRVAEDAAAGKLSAQQRHDARTSAAIVASAITP